MVFSSLVFLYLYLPIVLLVYYLIHPKLRNSFLFLASFVFFAWGGVNYSILLIISILVNYLVGLAINKFTKKKLFLGIGIFANLAFLVVFKYAGLLTKSANSFIGIFSELEFNVPEILLPIGISFYTFQAMSYIIDVYRKETKVQKNFINIGLYISMFPQLIAGPIVRYHDIAEQIQNRKSSIEQFSRGVQRFVLGLGKKVLIANNMAIIADHVFALTGNDLSFSAAWIGIIAYTLQIYYDFAGYSDMAIGLGRMFGFEITENFNFPYISKSIKEFWKRWHISLSTWFMKYLFLPLAYSMSRKLKKNVYWNVKTENWIYLYAAGITFILCGFWHGAAWNFVAWGALHGLFLILEQIGLGKKLKKAWKPLRHTYVIFFILMSWVLFRAESFEQAAVYYKALFNVSNFDIQDVNLYFLINRETISFFIIAVLGAASVFPYLNKKIGSFLENISLNIGFINISKNLLKLIFVIIVLIICTTYLVNNTYNPFIYFRF